MSMLTDTLADYVEESGATREQWEYVLDIVFGFGK